MDAGIGTSPYPNRGRISNPKSDVGATKTTDITQFKKAFGDKGLDQVLNQISDPQYLAKQKRVEGVGNPELGKDAFFKLMLTQLKQQDPTNPLKSHEMAAQLAQFSSVEQLSHIKEAIQRNGQKESHDQFQILNLMGKVVSGDSSKLKRVAGDKDHKIEFKLPRPAESVEVKIKDGTGKVVKSYELKNMASGKNKVVWNGLNGEDKEAPVGDYRAVITASNGGRKMTVNTKFRGPVDGVQFSKKGPLLIVGGKSMSLRDVQKIEINKEAQVSRSLGQPTSMVPQNGRPTHPMMPKSTMPPGGVGAASLGPRGPSVMPSAQQVAPAKVAPSVSAAQKYKPGQAAFQSPRNAQAQVTDVNRKYSKGAFETPQVLANLDRANMDNALREKLTKK